uniref:Lamina-associated polypeptide 2 alpha C-terminal domain-containing protein n=1 Tax=Xenopus tropicalis TaxID=8364 RepID=A0A1B8YAA6_XENTR
MRRRRRVSELISSEWSKAAKKISFNTLATRFSKLYPFKEQETKDWDSPPAVDPAVIHVSKKTTLPIDDSSVLKDPMDRRVETELRKVYQVAGASCKPAVALVSVAKAVSLWIDSLDKAVSDGTDAADISAGLSELKMAVAFMSEAAVDMTRLASRSMAVSVSARRALWLRAWGADTASKVSLCNLPYVGGSLFGPKLDEVISKATGGKSSFLPQEKKKSKSQPFRGFLFRGSGRAKGPSSGSRYFFRDSSRQSSWRGGQSTILRGGKIKSSPTAKKSS